MIGTVKNINKWNPPNNVEGRMSKCSTIIENPNMRSQKERTRLKILYLCKIQIALV